MTAVGQIEKTTQARVVTLFRSGCNTTTSATGLTCQNHNIELTC